MTNTKTLLSAGLLVAGVVLVNGLGGCAGRQPAASGTVIRLSPENAVAVIGEPLQLRAEGVPPGGELQWQKNGLDIPGAQNYALTSKKVTLEDAGLYRCRLKRSGETGETEFTSQVAVYTTGPTAHRLTMASIITPVAGPFQPNQPSLQSGCAPSKSTNYIRFRNASNSIWFKPPANAKSCRVTDTSKGGADYVGRIEVLENPTLKYFCGTGTPSTVSFPVVTTRSYQFVLFVLSSPPAAGQSLSAEIVWTTQ